MEVALFVEPAVQGERRTTAEHPTVADEQIAKAAAEKLGGDQTPTGNSSLQRSPPPDQKDSVFKRQQVSLTFSSEFASVMDSKSSRPSSSNAKDSASISGRDQLESTKAEMGEIREENERLKMMLSRVVKDYQSLQMHFFDIVQKEQAKKRVDHPTAPSRNDSEDESKLVSLSLGTSSSTGHKKEDKTSATKAIKERNKLFEEGLALGLDCRYDGSSRTSLNETVPNHSPDNTSDQETTKEEEPAVEAWPPSKVLKSLRSGDDDVAQQPQLKKARVSIRARCDAPTMNDGCQWRKYGQKVAKGNPCPRAYYRCTVAPSCPVRKQVQRCAEDLAILITTYEGTHNHPLPISATAMASTTSAAASMLLAGSSSSQPLAIDSNNSSSTSTCSTNAAIHGLNFSLSDTSRTRPFYQLPNTSICSTPSYPTITLDLTTPQSSSASSSHVDQFSRFSTSLANAAGAPRYTSTSFNFSSSETNSLPLSWNNGSHLSYGGSRSQQYNMSSPLGSLSLSRLSQEPFCQSFLQRAPTGVPAAGGASSNHAFTDTIAKALTSDPSFQSAIKEAITSYVGAQGGNPVQSTATTSPNACATSFLNRSTSSSGGNSQLQGSTLLLQPFLALSGSKSASASPVDHHRENIN